MMSVDDFKMKQTVFVFTRDGEKVAFSNDNLVVRSADDKIRFQCTCYRIYALFIVGNITITSGIIQRSHKFGFPIILMSSSLKTYDYIGHRTEGNFLLREAQYSYNDIELAKHVVIDKLHNQAETLDLQRGKDNDLRCAISTIKGFESDVWTFSGDYKGLMGIEGNAAKVFFRNNFNMGTWAGRKPKIKSDYINSTLDIGYTILFNVVDTMLNLYGFDTYRGIYHREFYMRKSLTCDLMEPFRPLIDWQVRKAINLGQCKPEDFNESNGRYLLDISKNKDYIGFLMKPLLDNKEAMFRYFQSYYRAFMKGKAAVDFPTFRL